MIGITKFGISGEIAPITYCDHNAFVDPESFMAVLELHKLGHISLCLSLWNLFELARWQNEAERQKKAFLIQQARPLFILDGFELQRLEVARLARAIFHNDHRSIRPFFESVGVYSKAVGMANDEVPFDVLHFVEYMAARPKHMKQMQKSALASVKNLTALRKAARTSPRRFRDSEPLATIGYVSQRLPRSKPDNQPYTATELQFILTHLCSRWAELRPQMPTIFIENRVSEFRISDKGRQSTPNDLWDVCHMKAGLGYCDYFVSNDDYVNTCASHVVESNPAPQIAKMVRTPSHLASQLGLRLIYDSK